MPSNWSEQTQNNVSLLEKEIEELAQGHWNLFKRDYRSFWAHAKRISQLFKQIRPMQKDIREQLWSKFSSVCEDTRNKQQSERKDKEWKSKRHRDDILSIISSAKVNTFFGFDRPDVQEMKRLGQVLKQAGDSLSKHKSEMFGEHKQECFNLIQEVRSSHEAWWKKLNHHRNRKQEEFRVRVQANIEKNHEKHRKATDALYRCQKSADELRDKIATSWNDNWASQAHGWLSELEDKIKDIEISINRIEDWIKEDEAKLM